MQCALNNVLCAHHFLAPSEHAPASPTPATAAASMQVFQSALKPLWWRLGTYVADSLLGQHLHERRRLLVLAQAGRPPTSEALLGRRSFLSRGWASVRWQCQCGRSGTACMGGVGQGGSLARVDWPACPALSALPEPYTTPHFGLPVLCCLTFIWHAPTACRWPALAPGMLSTLWDGARSYRARLDMPPVLVSWRIWGCSAFFQKLSEPQPPRSMHWMDAAMESPGWERLPSGVLAHVAYMVGGAQGMAASTTLLRLVCRGWRVGLPLCESGSGVGAARSMKSLLK